MERARSGKYPREGFETKAESTCSGKRIFVGGSRYKMEICAEIRHEREEIDCRR